MRYRTRQVARAVSATLILGALAVSPAAAAPPAGSCPGRYVEATYAEVLAEFPEFVEAFGEEGALAGLTGFDKNGNGEVCWMPFPESRVTVTKLFLALIIDDNAGPH